MQKKTAFGLLTLLGTAIVLLIFLSMTSGLIQQWLWMVSMGLGFSGRLFLYLD